MSAIEDFDGELARKLQEEYDREIASELENESNEPAENFQNRKENNDHGRLYEPGSISITPVKISPVDPSLEYTDPNPEIRELFIQFNYQFFWGKLSGIEVKWSPRMTLCAGLCVYEGRGGLCSVRLSLPLLKLRPRKDLVETLLHEMIHAFLFITDNDRDHDGHGPQFQKHMHRINQATGANISIYHTFHDEVESYQQHWWRCDGPCRDRKPFYGYVKRAMNRAPSAKDFWWAGHQASCGGTYTKIKEPEGYGQKKASKKEQKAQSKTIQSFGGKGNVLGSSSTKTDSSVGSVKNPASIFNFLKNASKPSTSSASGKSQLTSIVNGIIQKGPQHRNSPLFSNGNNVNAQIKTEKKSSLLNQPSSSKSKNVKSWVSSDDDDFKSHVKSGDNRVTKHRTSGFLKNHKKKKKSVCDGGFFDQEKKDKRYILDEVDTNDHLWDISGSDSTPVKSDISPLKVKLRDFNMNEIDNKKNIPLVNTHRHLSDESDKNSISQNSILQYIVKSEKHDSSSQINSSSSSSNKSTFPGQGFRLGKSGHSLSSRESSQTSSHISSTFGSRFIKGEKWAKDEPWHDRTGSGSVHGGLKRPLNEEVFEILDDSDEEEDDNGASLSLSKKIKLNDADLGPSPSSGTSLFGNQQQELYGSDENDTISSRGGGEGSVNCPACNFCVPESDINAHLDMCLQ